MSANCNCPTCLFSKMPDAFAAVCNNSLGQLQLCRDVDLNARSPAGHTPLMVAAYCNHAQCVRYLLRRGVRINEQADSGATALHFAAGKGNLRSLRVLLSDAHLDTEARSRVGHRTALGAMHRELSDTGNGG